MYPLGLNVSYYQRTMDWQRAISTGAKRIYAVIIYEAA